MYGKTTNFCPKRQRVHSVHWPTRVAPSANDNTGVGASSGVNLSKPPELHTQMPVISGWSTMEVVLNPFGRQSERERESPSPRGTSWRLSGQPELATWPNLVGSFIFFLKNGNRSFCPSLNNGKVLSAPIFKWDSTH